MKTTKDTIKEQILLEYEDKVGSGFILNESIEKVIDYASQIILGELKGGLIMSGRTGVGKTVLLKAIRKVWDRNNRVKMEYLPSSKLQTITIRSEGYTSTIDFRMPFLCLDDFGSEPEVIKHYGTTVTPFADIIQYRYDMKDTRKVLLSTTNLTPKMITGRYGDRVWSRLKGENKIVLMKGEDHRL